MHIDELTKLVVDALDEMKAVDVRVLDVRDRSSFTDVMVIASGTSSRHVKAMADNVMMKAKKSGVALLGSEGERTAEWILVDFGEVVVHVMQPQIRDFYNLEKLWSTGEQDGAERMKAH
ncbi:MAG: ribosome silencing factor [Gammaproteobacteria bacterium]